MLALLDGYRKNDQDTISKEKKRETFFEQLEEEDYVQKPIILCFDLSGI